jgi:hypothetical protein
MLGELLDHMEGAQEVASRIAQKYPDYEAMAEAVRSTVDMVAMACELKPTANARATTNGSLLVSSSG